MAEVIETGSMTTTTDNKHYASNGKANAGLTLGIIGTALSGVMALGGLGALAGFGSDSGSKSSTNANITTEELNLEREAAASNLANTIARWNTYMDVTKQYYEGKIEGNERLTNAFFDAYQRDVDNSFKLYQYSRDNKDEVLASQAAADAVLANKIAEVDKKVDIMAAIRPYQDSLIMEKMNYNNLQSEYNLSKRTCRMIEGNLVLPTGTYNQYCPPFVPWVGGTTPWPPFPVIDPSTN